MGYLHLFLLLLAGAFASGVVMHAQRAMRARWREQHLLLMVICLLSFAYLLIESHQLMTFGLDSYRYWYRIARYTTGIYMFVYPIFVARATGSSGRTESVFFGALALVFMWHNTLTPSGPWLTHLDHIEIRTLPWGEQIAIPRGPFSNWAYLAFAMWTSVSCYAMARDLKIRADGLLGPRVLLWTNAFFILIIAHDALILKGTLHGPFLAFLVPPILAAGVWWRLSLMERRRIESFRSLFVGSEDAILIHAAGDGRVIEANTAACRLFRSPRSLLIGSSINAIMAADSALGEKEFSGRVASLRAGGGALRERQLRRADGSEFTAEIALQLAILEGRERIVASYRDLADRNRVESALIENERRLRAVIARSPLAILETTMTGTVVSANPRFTEFFGNIAAQLSILDRFELPCKEDGTGPKDWLELLQDTKAQDGVIPSFRSMVNDSAGHRHRVDICGVISGERAVLFITDLTDILDARDAIARREAFYRVLVEVAVDGICVLSLDDDSRPVIALWNARMEEITGIARVRALSENWSEGNEDDSIPQANLHALLRRACNEPMYDEDWNLTRIDSSQRACTVSTVDLPRSTGGRRILISMRDVTSLKRAEVERQSAEAMVQHAQKLESLGMLAAGIAHDFNNILISILGRAGLMSSRLGIQHGAHGHLRDMEQASRRAGELCQQLLAYAGKGRTRVGAVDLTGMVIETSQVLSVSSPSTIRFINEFEPGLPFIHGDVNQVRQIVMNLITNASEAFGAEGGIVMLRLTMRRVLQVESIETDKTLTPGSYVVLEVTDTGCGMDEQTRKRIFEPFFTTKPRGRGLGMAAVLGILDGHGGGIQVVSAPGKGTTMRAWLPAYLGPPPEKTPELASPVQLPSGLVLVVDDEASIRRTTRDMLAHLGFDTIEASSGEEAIHIYQGQGNRISAVVLDLTMPGIDGMETMRRLREYDAKVQVLLASGYSRDEVARALGDQDITAFLQKPYDLEALASALHLALVRPTPP